MCSDEVIAANYANYADSIGVIGAIRGSEYVLQRELQYSWLVRTADLAERIVGQRTVWILRPEAVCQIESFRSKLHPLTLAYLEGSRQGNVE